MYAYWCLQILDADILTVGNFDVGKRAQQHSFGRLVFA
jgi:hypothetical protein